MPDKPSEGLRVALNDLILCEKHPDYIIEMENWHNPEPTYYEGGLKCEVCLGGAVLARVTDNPALRIYSLYSPRVTTITSRRIVAMDCFRRGNITEGVMDYLGDTEGEDSIEGDQKKFDALKAIEAYYKQQYWITYATNPDKFKKSMRFIADKLEAIGL